jgi:hypothetical protein
VKSIYSYSEVIAFKTKLACIQLSPQTHTKTGHFMMFREIMVVYSEKNRKSINRFRGQERF